MGVGRTCTTQLLDYLPRIIFHPVVLLVKLHTPTQKKEYKKKTFKFNLDISH